MLSGRSTSLAAIDDLHQATGDLNLVVGQKLNTTLGGDLQERIQGISPEHRAEGLAGRRRGERAAGALRSACSGGADEHSDCSPHSCLQSPADNAVAFSMAAQSAEGMAGKMKPISAG